MSRHKSPPNVLDLVGKVINGIKVIERAGKTKNHNALWLCKCHCGKEFTAMGTSLRLGDVVSCGCHKPLQIENARNILVNEHSVDGVIVPLLTKKVRSDSRTGVKGVYQRERGGRVTFEPIITVKGRQYYGKTCNTLEEAAKERKRLEEIYHKPIIDKYLSE